MTSSDPYTPENLYHERQRLALCGVHAVNNLLQTQRYQKGDFDRVCTQQLAPDSFFHNNPHRSCLGIGDYDVNVVTVLLHQEGLTIEWHDQRQIVSPVQLATNGDETSNKTLVGILWNVPGASIWRRLCGGRHWIALLLCSADGKDQPAQWSNLDSNLVHPQTIGSNDQCATMLNERQQESHVLFVFR